MHKFPHICLVHEHKFIYVANSIWNKPILFRICIYFCLLFFVLLQVNIAFMFTEKEGVNLLTTSPSPGRRWQYSTIPYAFYRVLCLIWCPIMTLYFDLHLKEWPNAKNIHSQLCSVIDFGLNGLCSYCKWTYSIHSVNLNLTLVYNTVDF